MKKTMFILLSSFVLILAACGNDEPEVKEEPIIEEETPEQDEVKVSFSEDSVSFTNFTIEFEEARVGDGALHLKTRYQNDSFPDEKSFMASATLQPEQNDEVLKEVSGVESDPKSNYYYKNATGINAPVEFEYELQNETDNVVLKIVPMDFENEETKEIIITFE